MRAFAWTGRRILAAAGAACWLSGCSVAAGPLYGHELSKGTSARPGDEAQTWSLAMRGLVHPQQSGHAFPKPVAFGLESEFGSTLGAKCCRARITPLLGVSSLRLTGSPIGWELLGGLVLGQTAVREELPFSMGGTVRAAMPIRLVTAPSWPCDKRPYGSLSWFLTPELGVQGVVPVHGSDHAFRTEAVGLLWLRVVGWTGLPVF